MQEKEIEKILRKRKPTAKDTLQLMLNDIIQSRITAIADKKGTLPPEVKNLWQKHFKVIGQDDYSKVILKLDEKEYKKHQRNVRLYNFYYDMIDELEREHKKTLVYFNCLISSFNYDYSTYNIPSPDTETKKYTYALQQYIAENIRAIKGYNAFVDAMKRETNNDFLEITKIELKELREAYKRYYETIRPAKENASEIYEQYSQLISDEGIQLKLLFMDFIAEHISDDVKGFKAFENINTVDRLKARIKYNNFTFEREGTTKEEIEAELKERQHIRELYPDIPDITAN